MPDILVVSYKSIIDPESAINQTLSEIIGIIRSDKHAKSVANIRNADTKEKADILKLNTLPAFLPTSTILRNGGLKPSGIVSFDIDLKDNETVDFIKLNSEIITLPECLYSFTSPSGGLKFGIRTDFEDKSHNIDQMRVRFKQAYMHTLLYVTSKVSTEFVDDKSVSSISQKCYLSHDVNTHYNSNARVININDSCIYDANQYHTAPMSQYDIEYIKELLDFIPSDFKYDKRCDVNFAVLHCLGNSGIALLLRHWDKPEKTELQSQIETQFKNLKFGSIGHLINLAKENGYQPKTGRQRQQIKPQKINIPLDDLLSADEGASKLKSIVQSFFDGKRNNFINVTAGAGKSSAVLDVLANVIPSNKRILFLVSRHNLADELAEKFKKVRNNEFVDNYEARNLTGRNRNEISMLLRGLVKSPFAGVIHLKGKSQLCEVPWALQRFGGNIPWQFCSGCPMSVGCKYLEQFNNRFDNIRIMTHNEWNNYQSVWFSGNTMEYGEFFPTKTQWKPDYIIVDENIINIGTKITDTGDKHTSVKNIICSVLSGKPLDEAVIENISDVARDSIGNKKPSFPPYNSDFASYEKSIKSHDKLLKGYSKILARFDLYCRTRDPIHLQGIWVDDNIINYAPIIRAAERYQDVPTLFLDATANQQVVKQVFPDVEFHSIMIQSKNDIHLYQLANATYSNGNVDDADGRQRLIAWIKDIVSEKKYNKVGLITFLNAKGIVGDFDAYLAEQLGITTYGHFGNLRGLDKFDDLDCLLIVGKLHIGTEAIKDLASAIFGEVNDCQSDYVDSPIRMKNGSACSLNSYTVVSEYHRAIHEHFSIAETKQAIGRARTIHGKTKDIYLFSNESLGLDIEVTDFFYKPATENVLCSNESISTIIEIGYVANRPSSLHHVGLNESDVKSRRDEIVIELAAADIPLITCNMRDSSNRIKPQDYFIADKTLFIPDAMIDKKKFVSFADL